MLREPNTLWVVVISTQSVLQQTNTLWVVIVQYPKCATTTQHTLVVTVKYPKCATTTNTLGSYCKVPKVSYYNPAHFGYSYCKVPKVCRVVVATTCVSSTLDLNTAILLVKVFYLFRLSVIHYTCVTKMI